MKQTLKRKWQADRGDRALKSINGIKAEIAALNDEDLLDLQDIFAGSKGSTLGAWASDEIQHRNLSA